MYLPEPGWPTDPRMICVCIALQEMYERADTDPNQALCAPMLGIPSSHSRHGNEDGRLETRTIDDVDMRRGYIGFTEECVPQTWMQRSIVSLVVVIKL